MKTLMLLVLLLLTVSVHSLSPIILIPGLIGSQLQARLRMRSTSAWFCPRYRYKYQVWFNLNLATTPGYDKCFRDYVKLKYDEATGEYHDNDGVQMKVPGFGDTETVEFLSKGLIKIPYFHFLVKYFVKRGYTRGVNLNAAPYDWRYAPDGHTRSGYYKALYQLIEDSYTRNGNTPVTLVVHSMGGPVSNYFLNRVPDEWKASRVKQLVSLSGAFGGGAFTLPSLTSGVSLFFMVFMDPLVIREAVRSWPSMLFLLPSPKLWSNEEVLVTRPGKTYTAHDYEALFADMNYENGTRIWNEVKDLTSDFPAPGVTHYCFYGTKVPTIETFEYGLLEFPDEQPRMRWGDGDGLVNTRSMESCSLWKDKQELPVVIRPFPFVDHLTILANRRVLDAIAEVVLD